MSAPAPSAAFAPASRRELKFSPLTPAPDVAFWQELTRRKLDVLRLDSSPIPVKGYFEAAAAAGSGEKCFFVPGSFEEAPAFPASGAWVRGELKNFNTVEEFRTYMKGEARQARVAEALQTLRDDIVSGAALREPLRLRPLLAVVFADLKKYVFSYTMAFPVLAPSLPWQLREAPASAEDAEAGLGRERLCEIARRLGENGGSLVKAGCFLLVRSSSKDSWEVRAVAELTSFTGEAEDLVVGFVDSSGGQDSFGWPLRNLLVAVAHHRPSCGTIRVLAFRDMHLSSRAADTPANSRLLVVEVAPDATAAALSSPPASQACVAGWSKINSIDLTVFLDMSKMAADAVDLNVKLMKWRILPDLEPERLREMRFLLLGAGTLGCSVARTLMGWGVRRMTFVDSGKVGLSNPVRQSLFTHQDAAAGRFKAEAARDAIKAVMPDAEAEAVVMDIPMPGHPHQSGEKLAQAVRRLQELIAAHDVVCMLTDSRESRWLPSLLVSDASRQAREAPAEARAPPLGLTVALGFDSFLVSRQTFGEMKAACYFCNDLTAPSDSIAFRTLDQQCTVTRPGLSFLASGVAVELVAALSQHKDGFAAPCSLAASDTAATASSASASLLGAVPHQVRGYLAGFRLAPAETEPFKNCVCCSDQVLRRYATEGMRFVERVVSDSSELEQVSGLAAMKASVREEEVLNFGDDEFDFAED